MWTLLCRITIPRIAYSSLIAPHFDRLIGAQRIINKVNTTMTDDTAASSSTSEVPSDVTKADNKGCWTKFSESRLVELEKKILEVLKTAYKGWFVPIGSTVGEDDKIWTLSLNEEKQDKTPLVLLHGFAAGVGFWCLNLDAVAENRTVYALDLLGFGRSSRPNFDTDSNKAEEQLVQSIEEWRKRMRIEKMILLGHSFGGYLATSYTLSYPERVKHLILADPWGFNEKSATFNPPLWIKAIAYSLSKFNPLATIRAAGPIGPWLVRKMRSDISEKYSDKLPDKDLISEYIYQCNSQKPSGETAFHSMVKEYAFPKNPMIHRIDDLNANVPMTIIYGSESWMERSSGEIIKEKRQNCYVKIEIIVGAGHHVHADQPDQFNAIVIETCQLADSDCDDDANVDKEKSEDEKKKLKLSESLSTLEEQFLNDLQLSNKLQSA